MRNSVNYVSAVMVTYNPDVEALQASIKSVLPQISDLYIVDNGSLNFSESWLIQFQGHVGAKIHLLPQAENLGLGAAHNIGIKRAIEQSSKYILILDQDSQVDTNMVAGLRSAYEKLSAAGCKVAALGPQYRDRQ